MTRCVSWDRCVPGAPAGPWAPLEGQLRGGEARFYPFPRPLAHYGVALFSRLSSGEGKSRFRHYPSSKSELKALEVWGAWGWICELSPS